MNRKLLFAAILTAVGVASADAQTYQQLDNSGFELFDNEGQNEVEPQRWNSFYTAGGSFAGTAKGKSVDKTTDVRPGSTGESSVKIWSRKVIFVVANGNLTTGKMMAGAMSATSTSNNNTTTRNDAAFNHAFTMVPDSMTIWAKYVPKSASDQARVSVIIHNDNNTQDPGTTADQVVAKAELNYNATADKGWQRLSIPFVAGASNDPRYILVSLTTNKTPGKGSVGDEVFFDDICMVYNATIGITEPASKTYNPGAEISIPYSVTGSIPDNLQTAAVMALEISDVSGSFDNAKEIATSSNLSTGTLTGAIPSDLATGAGYKLRVRTKNYTKVTELPSSYTLEELNSEDIHNNSVDQVYCAGSALNIPAGVSRLEIYNFNGQLIKSVDAPISPVMLDGMAKGNYTVVTHTTNIIKSTVIAVQ